MSPGPRLRQIGQWRVVQSNRAKLVIPRGSLTDTVTITPAPTITPTATITPTPTDTATPCPGCPPTATPTPTCTGVLTAPAPAGTDVLHISNDACLIGSYLILAPGEVNSETVLVGNNDGLTLTLVYPLVLDHTEGEPYIVYFSGPTVTPTPTATGVPG